MNFKISITDCGSAAHSQSSYCLLNMKKIDFWYFSILLLRGIYISIRYIKDTKDMAKFSKLICFHHNFLPNEVINLIFWPVIYNFPNRSIDVLVDHILDHKWSCYNGHYSRMAIMATMAPLYSAIIMADMGVYWKIRKSVDHLSKNLIDCCVK